jgi:HK97 family phage prohead protease
MTETLTVERALEREWRAKYKQADRDEMAKSGKAMSDGSYPIADEDDLKKAIKAVGRGSASHDSIRKHIISRAKALKLSSLIPDNWNADGSLKEEKSVWSTLEERETYNDLRQAVESAIADSLPKKKSENVYGPYVVDMTDDWAVYEYEGDLWQVNYTVDSDGEVTLGEPEQVRRITSYEANSHRADEEEEECPTCKGTGKIKGGSTKCPDCDGTGELGGPSENAARDDLERRARHAREREGMVEFRSIPSFELRDTADGHVRFSGYASTTESPYEIADFTETVAKGAFKRTLGEEPDVRLNINHGVGGQLPLARTKSGTLTLSEDARGLKVDADLDPNDPDVRSLLPKMRRGDVDEMSFAFRATAQEWNEDYTERLIRECALHRGDVSIVTTGANPDTSAIIRSADGQIELRIGKAISGDREAVIKEVLDHMTVADEHISQSMDKLSGVVGTVDTDIDAEPAEDLGRLKITVIPRSYVETAKARRARLMGGGK